MKSGLGVHFRGFSDRHYLVGYIDTLYQFTVYRLGKYSNDSETTFLPVYGADGDSILFFAGESDTTVPMVIWTGNHFVFAKGDLSCSKCADAEPVDWLKEQFCAESMQFVLDVFDEKQAESFLFVIDKTDGQVLSADHIEPGKNGEADARRVLNSLKWKKVCP